MAKVQWIGLHSCALIHSWSYPGISHAFSTVYPPSFRAVLGAFLLFLFVAGYSIEKRAFQSFLNVNCTVHSSQTEICRPLKIARFQVNSGTSGPPAGKPIKLTEIVKNNLILKMTPENRKKTFHN